MSSSINTCMEAAHKNDAPIMIQFSSGGSQFYAGKGPDNKDFSAAIAGAVSGAYHVHTMAEQYGVPVFLHSTLTLTLTQESGGTMREIERTLRIRETTSDSVLAGTDVGLRFRLTT